MKRAANDRTYKQIQKNAFDDMAEYLSVAFTYVLADKYQFGKAKLQQVLESVAKLSDEVNENRISLNDMKEMLYQEYDIIFGKGEIKE